MITFSSLQRHASMTVNKMSEQFLHYSPPLNEIRRREIAKIHGRWFDGHFANSIDGIVKYGFAVISLKGQEDKLISVIAAGDRGDGAAGQRNRV